MMPQEAPKTINTANKRKLPFNWNHMTAEKPPRSLNEMLVHLYKTKFDIKPDKSGLKKQLEINLKKEVAISQLNFVEMDGRVKKNIHKEYQIWEDRKKKNMERLDLENHKIDQGNEE